MSSIQAQIQEAEAKALSSVASAKEQAEALFSDAQKKARDEATKVKDAVLSKNASVLESLTADLEKKGTELASAAEKKVADLKKTAEKKIPALVKDIVASISK